jgi:hypothetical protein
MKTKEGKYTAAISIYVLIENCFAKNFIPKFNQDKINKHFPKFKISTTRQMTPLKTVSLAALLQHNCTLTHKHNKQQQLIQ